MSEINKRKRDPTFTYNEKLNLVEIVEKYFSIVECKKTDGESTRSKTAKWQEIATEFNATTKYLLREHKVLKNLWENLKKKAKAVVTSERQNTFATGGGPPKKIKVDPILEKVISLIRCQAEGYSNQYDGDFIFSGLDPEPPIGLEPEPLTDLEPEGQEDFSSAVIEVHNWSSFTPKMLKTPVTIGLRNNESVDNLDIEDVAGEATPQKNTKNTPLLPSRRRPKIGGDILSQKKYDALELSCKEATAEHDVKLRILHLQEKQEEEKLKQEVEKTTQLELQTAILKKQLGNLQ